MATVYNKVCTGRFCKPERLPSNAAVRAYCTADPTADLKVGTASYLRTLPTESCEEWLSAHPLQPAAAAAPAVTAAAVDAKLGALEATLTTRLAGIDTALSGIDTTLAAHTTALAALPDTAATDAKVTAAVAGAVEAALETANAAHAEARATLQADMAALVDTKILVAQQAQAEAAAAKAVQAPRTYTVRALAPCKAPNGAEGERRWKEGGNMTYDACRSACNDLGGEQGARCTAFAHNTVDGACVLYGPGLATGTLGAWKGGAVGAAHEYPATPLAPDPTTNEYPAGYRCWVLDAEPPA